MPTINNVDECTLGTCPIEYATVDYDPSLGGNAFYLAVFSLILFIQLAQGFKYRTWSFTGSMASGLILEIVGYVGRVQMHFNPFLPNPFLIYIICVTIGPVFFSAAIYLTLSRIMVHYGPEYSRFSPKAISIGFMTADFIALVLQAAGGAIADTANTQSGSAQGTHIMVAGLSFQAFSLLGFIAVATMFALRVRTARMNGAYGKERQEIVNGRSNLSFKFFLTGIAIATIFILTRSCFRVAELAKGFDGKLANEEVPFMILEGAMIILATTTLTVFHPGRAFGEKWTDAGWQWKKERQVLRDEETLGSGSGGELSAK